MSDRVIAASVIIGVKFMPHFISCLLFLLAYGVYGVLRPERVCQEGSSLKKVHRRFLLIVMFASLGDRAVGSFSPGLMFNVAY